MSAHVAFDALSRELPDVVRLLPNVERIEPISLDRKGSVVERRDRWHGRSAASWVRALLPTGVASWPVRTTWDQGSLLVTFELEPHSLPIALHVEGEITFRARDHAVALVDVEGEVRVGRPRRGVIFSVGAARAERVLADLIVHNVSEAVRLAEASRG